MIKKLMIALSILSLCSCVTWQTGLEEDKGPPSMPRPKQVTSAEITAGTESDLRSYAPDDIVSFISTHGGGGSGETNTASNQGTDGVGVFYQKTGVDLEFRHIAPGSNKTTVTLNGQDIDINVSESNFTDIPLATAVTGQLPVANGGTGASDASGARTNLGCAPSSEGVTNGDSHDHSGGDGAQIDHGGLAGLDDNDHGAIYYTEAEIDAALALKVDLTGGTLSGNLLLSLSNPAYSFTDSDTGAGGKIWLTSGAATSSVMYLGVDDSVGDDQQYIVLNGLTEDATFYRDVIVNTGKKLFIGSSTSLDETTAADDSGAYLIGTYDEFANSDSTNAQDVLDDLDAAISTKATATGQTYTGAHDFSGGTIKIASGTTLPGTCSVGHQFLDTDADTDGSLYTCVATDTWKEVDDDGSAGGISSVLGDSSGDVPVLFQTWSAFTASDTTPDVSTFSLGRSVDTTTINDFDGTPVDGQVLYVYCGAATVFDFTSSGLEAWNRSTDLTCTVGQILAFKYRDTQWYCQNCPDEFETLSSDGIVVNSSGTPYARTLQSTSGGGFDWTNGDGVSGNPTPAFDLVPSSGSATLIEEEDALQVKYDSTLTESSSGLGIADSAITAAKAATVMKTDGWNVSLGNDSDAITTGKKILKTVCVPFKHDLEEIGLCTDETSGSITIDVWIDEKGATTGLGEVADADSLFDTASEPVISDASSDNCVAVTSFDSGEDTDIPAGTCYVINVDSASTLTYANIAFKVTRKD